MSDKDEVSMDEPNPSVSEQPQPSDMKEMSGETVVDTLETVEESSTVDDGDHGESTTVQSEGTTPRSDAVNHPSVHDDEPPPARDISKMIVPITAKVSVNLRDVPVSKVMQDEEFDEHPANDRADENLEMIYEGRESIRSMELEELPREDDMTAEELELNQPLEAWVAELVPGMRELLAPQLYSVDESELLDIPPGPPVEPLEHCAIPAVLVSQSPMMQRFQASLKAHLLRQKEKLENDIYDMERECDTKDKEIREIGLTINLEQEHLIKQRDLVVKYRAGIEEVTSKRKQYDTALSKKNKELKDTEVQFKDTTTEDKSLFQQCEEMNELAFRLSEMEKVQNNELKFAKNLSEKQRADRIVLSQEKQKQDLYIWKLNQELERLGMETKGLIEETELKKREISELTQVVTDIEADTEALRKENSMIICATQQIVHQVRGRDKGFQDSNTKVSKAADELQIVLTRIRSYNKSIRSEDERRSMLLSSKTKLDILMQRNQHQAQMLVLRHEEALEKLAQVQNLINRIDDEHTSRKSEQGELGVQQKGMVNEIDELTLKRVELKHRYLNIMSEMKIQSAVTKKLQKSMEELSHDNQDIGLRKLEVECKIGELMTEIEHSKVRRVQLEVKIDNIKNLIKDKESELRTLDVQKKKLHQQILTYKSKVIGSKKRLMNLIKFNDDSEGQNQLSRRANTLNSELIELDDKINQVKQTWMDTQNSLIEQTYKLSQLESATNTTRKHLFLIRYKKEKLEAKMTELESDKKKADKEFVWYHTKLTSITLENYRHEQSKEKLADMAKEAENKFVSVLKDAEEEAVSLQEELCYLEEGNSDMTEDIERLQREFLAWEKKWKMAVEARERVEKERAATGEIGAMKVEIHRMQVRYSQLRKVQERLAQDLDLCISRRDNIMDLALAKEKRSGSSNNNYSRDQFNKKLDNIRQKIKQLTSGMKSSVKEVEEMELKREQLMREYMRKEKQLVEVKQGVDKLEHEIQEGQLHKYRSLELVVRQQRKIRLLDDVKHNRYRLFTKNENNLPLEEERQDLINSSILQVVQSLIGDFPKLNIQLLQIYNTITAHID